MYFANLWFTFKLKYCNFSICRYTISCRISIQNTKRKFLNNKIITSSLLLQNRELCNAIELIKSAQNQSLAKDLTDFSSLSITHQEMEADDDGEDSDTNSFDSTRSDRSVNLYFLNICFSFEKWQFDFYCNFQFFLNFAFSSVATTDGIKSKLINF